MVLVDSSVWIDFFNDAPRLRADRFTALVRQNQVLVGDLILAEVLQGFRLEKDFLLARRLLSQYTTVGLVNPSLAVKSAKNYRTLRFNGFTIRKSIDCLIATWCIENGVPLFHSDRDYGPFERHLGLVVL